MDIIKQGIDGEQKARRFLRTQGITNIQQLDLMIEVERKYYVIEVKVRDLFNPPPFYGTGLDIKQIKLRLQLYKDTGFETILLVLEKNTDNIYMQKLLKLEEGKYYDTRNGIRIYPIENFVKYNYSE